MNINQTMLEKIILESSEIEDYLVTSKKLGLTSPGIQMEGDKKIIHKPELIIPMEQFGEINTMQFSDNAILQVAAKMNIGSTYLSRLYKGNEWENHLFTRTLNDHFDFNTPDKNFLLRTYNGKLKGFLSDSFERYSSTEVLIEYLTQMKAANFNIEKVYYDGITYFIEHTKKDKPIMINDQVHWLTVQYRNSDFGQSALDIRLMITKEICSNGLVLNSIMRSVHKGKTITAENGFKLSDKTSKLEAELKKSIISDVIPQIISEENITRIKALFDEANAIQIPVESVMKKLPSVNAGKGDIEKIQNLLMNNAEETGVANCGSVMKVVNAISYLANDFSEEDGEGANKYKEMSGKLLSKYVKF